MVDAEGQSIEIVTIHSSKGLEWPVVIPINTASGARPLQQFVHRRADDTLHWVLGEIVPPSLAEAMASEAAEASQEPLRLLYVACTRAMDLLVLPELSWADDATWARALDFRLGEVPELDISRFVKQPIEKVPEAPNAQTRAVFATEQAEVEKGFRRIHWIGPSDGDPDIVPVQTPAAVAWEQPADPVPQAAGSSLRGVLLHKLMEELLTGEVAPSVEALQERCQTLIPEVVAVVRSAAALDPDELAATAWHTFCLPDLAHDRQELVPEVPVYATVGADPDHLVSGRADAVRYKNARARIVFDWKSDVAPSESLRAAYRSQVRQYARALGAPRAAVVYMSLGQVEWVEN